MDPPNPSRFGAAPKWTRIGPPNPSRFGAATQLDKDGTRPTLHVLERFPNGQGLDPQPFTTWRVFLSRKLTADFLLPNSAYKMCHLHQAVGRSRGSLFSPAPKKRLHPPPFHDLGRLPNGQGKRTRVAPPQPFTIWSGSHMDQDWTPQTFTIWSGSQMDKDWTPPTLHDLRFGAATQMDKDETPPTFHDLELPHGQGLDPPTLHDLERFSNGQGLDPPNPSRFAIWERPPKWTRMSPPQPFTIWSGSQMDKDWTPPDLAG